jgi:hypothetical protein
METIILPLGAPVDRRPQKNFIWVVGEYPFRILYCWRQGWKRLASKEQPVLMSSGEFP